MNHFTLSASTPTVAVKVAQYRDALRFAEHCANRADSLSCRWDEVIRERSNYLMSLFRAIRELQSMTCKRMNADDKARYVAVIARAERVLAKFGAEYFENLDNLSVNQSDEEIHWNWAGSRMADSLTYLLSPVAYPAQYARVVAELQPAKKRHLSVV